MENIKKVPQKIKNRITIWYSHASCEYKAKENYIKIMKREVWPRWQSRKIPSSLPPIDTANLQLYKFLRRQVRWSGIPISLRVFHSLLWFTQSKDLVYSMNQKQLFFWNSLAFSMIPQMLAIWSLVPLSLWNPAFTLLQRKHVPSRSLKNAFCSFAGAVKDRNCMFSWLQVWSYEEKMAK